MNQVRADDYIQYLLGGANQTIARILSGDVILIRSPIRFGLDGLVRLEIERLHEQSKRKRKLQRLIVILETSGGYIEVVERLYNVFRKHYILVDFIIPNFAYSAGTVLALSGDNIYMDYYSVLGPIDPQYEASDGNYVPGLGYLQKYNELREIINDKNKEAYEFRAELAYLLNKFDPAILFHLEQAKNHSLSLLKAWLPRHKFKDWKVTRTRKKKVTLGDRKKRAEEIGEILSNPERWHSHGRGIGLRELTSKEINLEINNFGENADLNSNVRSYHDLLVDYVTKTGYGSLRTTVIHTRNGLRTVGSQ